MDPKARWLATCLALAIGLSPSGARLQAQLWPSPDLLLPYFEVDLTPNPQDRDLTTVFSVVNSSAEQVRFVIKLYTNWGVPVLEAPIILEPRAVLVVDLWHWLEKGGWHTWPEARQLVGTELEDLKDVLTGKPFYDPGEERLIYCSTEVESGHAVGYVTIETQGNRDVLWGDYHIFQSRAEALACDLQASGEAYARGDILVNMDPAALCECDCSIHGLRYLQGGPFNSETRLVVRTARHGAPADDAVYPPDQRIRTKIVAYNQRGEWIAERGLELLPSDVVEVRDLELPAPFGWLRITTEIPAVVAVRYSAACRYSVALETVCLPPEACAIDVEKSTNGADADRPPGPTMTPGADVTWGYEVTNTGQATLDGITVVDDQLGEITCPKTVLEPGESMTCDEVSGIAEVCQYRNVATASGWCSDDEHVEDKDSSHYFGAEGAAIRIEKSTNDDDADAPPGPRIHTGEPVTWTYTITNVGEVPLTDVIVTDDQLGALCDRPALAPGGSFTCEETGVAGRGQYGNLGAVSARTPCGGTVSAEDPSHYLGVWPAIELEKRTNGERVGSCDDPNVPRIPVDDPVEWSFEVINVGDVTLTDVQVTDDPQGAASCQRTTLEPGARTTCTVPPAVAVLGEHPDVATASGQPPVGERVTDSDPGCYVGVLCALDVEKLTNGADADLATGSDVPEIAIGDPVQWTYVVTNVGQVRASAITVSDDRLGPITCPQSTLEPTQSMTCMVTGSAEPGLYGNLATVAAPGCSPDDDPSHYLGVGIDLEKHTDGDAVQVWETCSDDPGEPPGPVILTHDPVYWTYEVTNIGGATLRNVAVVDNHGVAVSCPATELAPAASMTCTAAGTAIRGLYTNVGTATGTSPRGTQVSDEDPSCYIGEWPEILIEKRTNGVRVASCDDPDVPEIPVGDPVEWTYTVINPPASDPLHDVKVVDPGVSVDCPRTELAVNDSMVCTAFGSAVLGKHPNVATATGVSPLGLTVSATDRSCYEGVELGGQGCTPGYWKNHLDSWPGGYSPDQTVGSVFGAADTAYPDLAAASLHEALSFGGGSGDQGAARILLRAAVAGVLNAAHPGVSYPASEAQMIAAVDAALASQDRDAMLALASAIDSDNNLGCPLS